MAVSVTPIRDTKWLTLEVCREFQRGTCSRPDTECKFAHPSKSCQVENGRVIACFDSLKVSKYYIIFKDVWLMKEAVVARGTPQPNGSKCWLPAVECFAAFILLMLVDLCCCFPQGKGKDIWNEGKIHLAGLKSFSMATGAHSLPPNYSLPVAGIKGTSRRNSKVTVRILCF